MRFWGDYTNIIQIFAEPEALYLSVFTPFRVGHPPLNIPWNEITLSRTRRFWRRYVVLTLGEHERIPMRISERMAHKLGILECVPEASRLPVEPNIDTLSESFIASQIKKPD
jgi:hypothetical protein